MTPIRPTKPVFGKLPILCLFWISCSLASHAQEWMLPKDAQGWTILNPSEDSRIIYVSSTDGDDATASFYTPEQVGGNPRHPNTAIQAYENLTTALSQMRDGFPDWLLLKRGDTFSDYAIDFGNYKSGRSAAERGVITWYGETGERPVLDNCSLTATGGPNQFNNRAIIGLDFYHSAADPDSPNFQEGIEGTGAIGGVTGGANILIEDCKVRFYQLTMQGYDAPWHNLEIRRNILTDPYDANACNSGQGASTVFVSGLLIT